MGLDPDPTPEILKNQIVSQHFIDIIIRWFDFFSHLTEDPDQNIGWVRDPYISSFHPDMVNRKTDPHP